MVHAPNWGRRRHARGILPGYPASHGCIRMPSDGAKLFYDHVKVGTPVRVAAAES